ncbi:MAG: VCBS repeat-containing protein, partial [Candidatus Latescibacteria bacterium]|nr:VCBS repeat-containing protein [Candidatus Latescibacterota bacterium]
MKTPTRMVLKLLLLGLAAIPWFLDRADGPKDAFASQDDIGLGLTESASAVGINFTHRTSPLDPALSHILPSVFGMGASASVTDVNNDGWLDLYLTTSDVGGLNALYINRWDGTFEDMAARYGLADVNQAGTGVSMGAVWADYDSDGLDDMLLYKWGRLTLYHQERDSLFIDVSQESGLGWWMNAGSAIWLDYDNDGDLDIYVGGYYKKGLDLWNLSTTKIMPNSFEYATNGGRNFLLANQGDGTFVDVTEAANADCGCWTLALGAVDLTGDLFPEIVIANDYGQDVLLINRDGERFERGVPGDGKPKSGMNIAFGDVMNDSVQSLYITNISKSGYLAQGNDLWRWLGGGSLKA